MLAAAGFAGRAAYPLFRAGVKGLGLSGVSEIHKQAGKWKSALNTRNARKKKISKGEVRARRATNVGAMPTQVDTPATDARGSGKKKKLIIKE